MFKKTKAIMSTLFVLSSCSSGLSIRDYPETSSPVEELTLLESDMNLALENNVNVLSPRNFENANNALLDARNDVEKQRDSKTILHDVAISRAYLLQAQSSSEIARNTFTDVMNARRDAVLAEAPKLLPKEFLETDELLSDVTSEIEKNNLKKAANKRSELQLKYLDLELRAIKISKIGEAKNLIKIAEKEGAKEFAPRSLAQARKSVLDTEAYITANRHDSEVVIRSNETIKVATHLLKITRNSKSGEKGTSEDQALNLEGEQNKVISKQGELDQKDSQLESTRNKLLIGNAVNSKLKVANTNLNAEKTFNQRFEEARSEFNSNEAEVYKQGDTLTVRLKGLEFPSAQAVLKGSNFPLLAKVQKVITGFGNSSVTIEGHTDSEGGKVTNEKLSTARADAVKDYFLANAGDFNLNIKTIGYGYQKPLATNKTQAGRAQNRRVDILIQPIRE